MALEKNENFFELTDENDRASAIEAQFNEDALENARRKTLPETNPDFDGLHCIDCDEKILDQCLDDNRALCDADRVQISLWPQEKFKFCSGCHSNKL